MEELAIKIEHVSKEYRLGAIGGGTLRGDLQSWAARMKGKEDPNSKIGSDAARHAGEKFLALDDVSFDVKKGEALGIIGHNGAGKSTLLKLLSRVTAPTKGTISYNGRIASMLEVGTGFHPELTGRENVYMNGAILGMTKAEISRKFDQIVEFAEMEKFIDTPVKRYSSGMYVKLAFAVAAHLDSEIMVMDEVLAVGDMKFQQKCLGKMGDAANSEGRTVLYVSHNMNTIRQLCTRCIVLDHGRLVFDGDTERAIEVYAQKFATMKLVNECDAARTSKDIDKKIHVDRIQFMGKERQPVYVDDEPIKLKIDYSATKEINNLAFRFILQTPDKMRVGMTTTQPCIHAKENDNTVVVTIPPNELAPGKYTCFVVAYSVNDMGTEQVHDRIEDAFVFEKTVNAFSVNNMTWNHSTWGHILLPQVEVNNEYED
jgi:ABC-type polysaccharide/polyol phosphate transport system ATPase subunit